jgi:hypothetical protein
MSERMKPKPVRERMAAHRVRLRAEGLRPIQIWVPEVDSPSFKAEAHRQSLAVANRNDDDEDQVFIDAVTDWSDA